MLTKTEADHLAVLRHWMADKDSVVHMEVRAAVIYFRDKSRPDFIPADVWRGMLSWG